MIHSLLASPSTTFSGRHYRLSEARCEPKPVQRPRPPIVIGGTGERRTARVVARWADHWNLGFARPEDVPRKLAALAGHCADAGRDPGEIDISVVIRTAGRDERRDLGEVADEIAAYEAARLPDRDRRGPGRASRCRQRGDRPPHRRLRATLRHPAPEDGAVTRLAVACEQDQVPERRLEPSALNWACPGAGDTGRGERAGVTTHHPSTPPSPRLSPLPARAWSIRALLRWAEPGAAARTGQIPAPPRRPPDPATGAPVMPAAGRNTWPGC